MFTSPNESFLLGEGGGGLGVHRDLAFSTSFLLDNESPSHLPATSQHWLHVCDHLQGPTPAAVDEDSCVLLHRNATTTALALFTFHHYTLSLFCMNWEAAPGSPQEGERETSHDGVRGVTPGNREKGWTCLQVEEVKREQGIFEVEVWNTKRFFKEKGQKYHGNTRDMILASSHVFSVSPQGDTQWVYSIELILFL
jgi:hypothetical protein